MITASFIDGLLIRGRSRAHFSRGGLFFMMVTCVTLGTYSQTIYNIEGPEHTTCSTALPICGDITYNVSYTGGTAWHYFTFVLEESTFVDIEVTSPFGAVDLSGPCDEIEPLCDQYTLVPGCSIPLTSTSGPPAPWVYRWTSVLGPGVYYISRFVHPGMVPGTVTVQVHSGLSCDPLPCEGCLPSFSPLTNDAYIVNAWVKEEDAPLGTKNYTKPKIIVEVPPGNVVATIAPVPNSSPMVDGWQLLEGEFIMSGSGIRISLVCDGCVGAEGVLFDDVRFFPADGSMKSYVYDPENLRFVAELDERHFATLYEYDNEGKLVRVKKETERGIKTLKETRQNAPHRLP